MADVRDQIRRAKEDAAQARKAGKVTEAAKHSARADALVRKLLAPDTSR